MSKGRICFTLHGESKEGKSCLLWGLVCGLISVIFGYIPLGQSVDLAQIQITDKTNPKIAELYQQLQDKRNEISNIESKRVDALTENANAMRENENRIENRILGATTTATTGIGAMTAAAGLAETRADADALRDMRAYLATFKCEYGDGQTVDYGPNDVALPGGNELIEYYNEYKSLAESLQETKSALGLTPGIESETVADKSQSGLYQNAATGITTGVYASLARGILAPDGDDAAQIAAEQEKSAQKLKIGATALGAGIIGGIIGNYELNKDAPKEQSEQINQEYDTQVATLTQETQTIETDLETTIAENAAAVQAYNAQLDEHQQTVTDIIAAPQNCQELFNDYIARVGQISRIENDTDVVPATEFPDLVEQQEKLKQCTDCAKKGGVFDSITFACPCPDEKPIEKDGICTEKPVEKPVDDSIKEEIPEKGEEKTDADMCPKTGNALKSITDKNKVGDSCTSDIISQGTITKHKNGTCRCNATGCWAPYTPKGGQCVKDKSETKTGTQNKNNYVDENGFCKPYKHSNWFFNNEGNEQISKYFNKICDDFAKAHSCKRKDLNTGKRINTEGKQGKPGYAFEYEWVCNADSEDYLAAQGRINQRNANLSYENVCKTLEPGKKTKQGEITRMCVGLFADINIPDYKTQLELAKARIGTSAACSEEREIRRNKSSNNPTGYYTNCNTTNDKERYTFIFSGVSNNNTTPENFMRAVCAIYGVKFGGQGGELGRKQPYCSYTYKSVDNDPTCNKIDSLAQKFGYTARIVRGTGCVLDTTGGVGGNQLAQSGMRSDEKIRDLKTAWGIDNSLFANISTNMDEWLYDQMKNIVSNEMKRAGHSDPLVEFECFPTKSFALDRGVEAKLFRDVRGRNVLTCRANGRDIDFIFHNLGHVTKRRANASQEGLTCIFGSNGKYDGRQCWGITEEDCKKLDAAIKEHAETCAQCGAKWLPNPGDTEGFCSLTKSTKVEKTNKGLEIAGNIALIAGGAVLTVMSGGMAMPMLVTEIALMGVELTGATVAAAEEKHMRNVAEEFLRKTQYCHDATCAQELLTDSEVHRILNLESNLDDKISNTIDDKMSELLGVIPDDAPLYVALLAGIEDKPNCNFWRNATAQCEWAQFWHAWANVAQFASLGVALGRSAVRFIHARQAITKVATQTAKKMTRAQAKRIQSIDENIARYQKQLKTAKGSEAKKLQAEIETQKSRRARILNEVGAKDADELATLSRAAYKPEIEAAQTEYQKLLKEREALAKRIGTDKAPGKVELQDIDRRIAAQEQRLKELGAEVEPVEPLWKPQQTTPKTEPKAEPNAPNPEMSGAVPATPQSRVYDKLDTKAKADIAAVKQGKYSEVNIPKNRLSPAEWEIVREDLAKQGLELKEQGSFYYMIKKADKLTVGEIATKDSGTIIRESKNLSPTQQQELYSKLTDAQKKSIAQMKINAGEVKLPFGATADDLAKNPDLLTLSGEYLPLNQKALAKVSESLTLSRYNELINKRTLTSAEKAELEQLRVNAQPELKELRHMLSNDVGVDNIIANGTQYKEKLIGIISSDPQLTRQAQNFDKLSKTQKENFLNKVADELNTSFSGGDPRLKPKVDVKYIDSWAEVKAVNPERVPDMNLKQPGMSMHHSDGSSTIYILNTYPNNLGYGSKLDDTMSLLAHEHGHAMDGFAADKVATGESSLFDKMLSVSRSKEKTTEAFAEYIFEPTELSSRGINEVVGTNFTKDLNNAIESGKLTTSPISDIQKIRIQSGYTGEKSNFVLSPKQTNELGIDYYKFAPSTERTGSLQPIVDNIKERGIEHVAIIKEDGKDVVAIFDNADDYAVAMRKVNASGGADNAAARSGKGVTDDIKPKQTKSAEPAKKTNTVTNTEAKIPDEVLDDMSDIGVFGVNSSRLRNGNLNSEELTKLRKYYPNMSDAELQEQAKKISKELDAQRTANYADGYGYITNKERRFNQQMFDEEMAAQRAANNGLTNAEKNAIPYVKNLNISTDMTAHDGGWWIYVERKNFSNEMMHSSGLKFHVNIDPDDVEKATPLIQKIISKYDVPEWKFAKNPKNVFDTDPSQIGKQVTIYIGKDLGENSAQLKQLVRELDQTLTSNGIRTGKIGSNLATGDKMAEGSKFVHYRYENLGERDMFQAPASGDVMATKATSQTGAKSTTSASSGGADDAMRGTTDLQNTKNTTITQSMVDDILVRNDDIAKENFRYIAQVENSGPEGQKWVELWRENAPKNQSLRQFQQSFGNDLNDAERLLTGLDDAAIKKEYADAYDAYFGKYDRDSYELYWARRKQAESKPKIYTDPNTRLTMQEFEKLNSTTPGFESWTDEQFKMAGDLYDAEDMRRFKRQGAVYSTFNPEISKINKETKAELDALDKDWETLVESYRNKHGSFNGFDESMETQEFYNKKRQIAADYQYKIGQIALENEVTVSREMVENFDKLILQDASLNRRMTAWETLSTDDKLTLLQDAMDAYAKKYQTPFAKIVPENIPVRADGFAEYGHYDPEMRRINFNTNSATGGILHMSSDDAISALLHEYGHQIDDMMPSKGSVGPQIMQGIGQKAPYTSHGPTYVLAPTEQSSYSHSGTVLTGGNWPLEEAKRRINKREILQNLSSTDIPDMSSWFPVQP